MLTSIKKVVKKLFNVFGLEVRKKIHAPLDDAILYNDLQNLDAFYANEKLVSAYINPQRISFYREIIQTIIQHIDLNKTSSIADVSAGTGHLLKLFYEQFPGKNFFGYEYSNAALELCKKNCPNIPFQRKNIYEKLDKTFDLILCVDTLEHLEEPEKVVNNLLDALTPTGFLCIVVPNGRYDTFEGHIHYWSPESLILFMKKIKCNISHKHVWNKYGEQCVIIQK